MTSNVFVGYDTREDIAYQVCEFSIKRFNSNVAVTPLVQHELRQKKIYWREIDKLASTEFTFTRFLVPHLMNFKGWALFMDCDMLMLSDISELWKLRDDNFAVQVCKHDYTPRSEKKFLGQVQTNYEKKNWSSFMLMNCDKCKSLTPEYVNTRSGLELHQFKWLESDNLIGEIPLEWNWLVGEYQYKSEVNNIHFTEGGPWFEEYESCDYSNEWFKYYKESV